MQKLFAFQDPEPIKACTFLNSSDLIIYATNARLVVFSLLKASIIEYLKYPSQLSPIQPVSISRVSQNLFLLQSRNGWMLMYNFKEGKLHLQHQYRIGYTGFARIGTLDQRKDSMEYYYYFDEERIELYRTDGFNKFTVSFILDEDDKISHISHMYARRVSESKENVFICLEGGRILMYQIVFREKKEPICSLMETYMVLSKSEPNVVLDCLYLYIEGQPKLLCSMRESNLILCDLDTKQNKFIELSDKKGQTFYRLLSKVNDKIYAISNNKLGRLNLQKLTVETINQFGKHPLINDFNIVEGLAIAAAQDNQLVIIQISS